MHRISKQTNENLYLVNGMATHKKSLLASFQMKWSAPRISFMHKEKEINNIQLLDSLMPKQQKVGDEYIYKTQVVCFYNHGFLYKGLMFHVLMLHSLHYLRMKNCQL